ncbi:MAG: hypothetical protein IJK58_06275 [Clostridia bacterium]|nr:hypothetical protein [Clostridia bacterium]
MLKKPLILILAFFMILPLFASCGRGGANETGGPKETDSQPTVTGAATEDVSDAELNAVTAYVEDIAAGVDFAGKDFNLITRDDESSTNFPKKEQETGIIEEDAVYFRQRDVEEFFGVNIDYVLTENGEVTADRVINEVTAGGSSYDLVCGSIQTTGQTLLNASVIRQVDNLDYVDLDREWWVPSLRDDYSICGRLFFLTGPIVVQNYQDTTCILFNKKVTEMFDISDDEIYGAVRDGKWTIDRMIEIASAVPENPDFTGTWRYVSPTGYAWIFAAGLKITEFDEEGKPSVAETLPIEISNLSDKLCPIFSNKAQTAGTNYKADESAESVYGVETLDDLFVDNRALFKFAYTRSAMDLRKFDVSFGIIPMPKATESQKDYCSYARMGMDSAVYIPRTVANVRMTDAITEALGALSQFYVKEAYYEKLLKGQSVFDLESREMIDIILQTKVYDLIALYSGADFNQMGMFLQNYEDSFTIDNTNLVSGYRSNARICNFNAKQLVKAVNKIED